MKSKAMILAAVCLGLFVVLSGCVECEKDSDCKSGQVCTADGACETKSAESLGVNGKFVLPDGVWEGTEFPVDLQVENKGEHDVLAGYLDVYLGGITFGSYGTTPIGDSGLLQDTNTYDLAKVRKEGDSIISGGLEDITFDNVALTAPEGQKDITMSLVATLCYPYKTTAKATVCEGDIKPGEKYLCKSNEDKEVISSKAPIRVTKVTQSGARQQQTFIIYFENVGGGIAYTKELAETNEENCVTSLQMQDKGWVRVSKVKIGETELTDCETKAEERGTSLAAGRIVCTYPSPQISVTESTLEVELEYFYKEETIKSFKIQGV